MNYRSYVFLSNGSAGASGLLLGLMAAVISFSTLSALGEDQSTSIDYTAYLNQELARLGKMVKKEGLNQEAKDYINKRLENVKLRLKSATEGSPVQVVEFMNTQAVGTRFVYVLDKSSSMSGKRMRAAKEELVRSLSQIRSDNQFYVIFYDTEAYELPGANFLFGTSSNMEICLEWLDSIRPSGKTKPQKALYKALKMKPDAMFLLSDGLFKDDIPPYIRAINDRTPFVVINTISFMSRKGAPVLQRIANENAGQYVVIGQDGVNPVRRWLGRIFRPDKDKDNGIE